MARALAFVALLAVFAGCAPKVESGGITVYADVWEQTTYELGVRANIDMGRCPGREFVLMQRHKSVPVQVAVEGCGVAGIYERRVGAKMTRHPAATWVLTTRGEIRDAYAAQHTSESLRALGFQPEVAARR